MVCRMVMKVELGLSTTPRKEYGGGVSSLRVLVLRDVPSSMSRAAAVVVAEEKRWAAMG